MITEIEIVETACRNGGTIRMVMPDTTKLNKLPTYHLSTTGEEIGKRVLNSINHRLEPVVDGLFPKGPSQNYKLKGGDK